VNHLSLEVHIFKNKATKAQEKVKILETLNVEYKNHFKERLKAKIDECNLWREKFNDMQGVKDDIDRALARALHQVDFLVEDNERLQGEIKKMNEEVVIPSVSVSVSTMCIQTEREVSCEKSTISKLHQSMWHYQYESPPTFSLYRAYELQSGICLSILSSN